MLQSLSTSIWCRFFEKIYCRHIKSYKVTFMKVLLMNLETFSIFWPHLSQFSLIIPDKKEIGLLKEKPNNHKTFKEPYIIKDLWQNQYFLTTPPMFLQVKQYWMFQPESWFFPWQRGDSGCHLFFLDSLTGPMYSGPFVSISVRPSVLEKSSHTSRH